jgi:hypothetical protein
MIAKLLLLLTAALVLLGSLYLELYRRNEGVLDSVKPQQVPALRSAKTIRDYKQ